MKNINVRISDEQDAKIHSSGMNYSEYVRRSIDFYDLRREEALIHSKINMIDKCMDELKKLKENELDNILKVDCLYKKDEIVKKSDDKILYKSDENVKNLYKNSAISLQSVKKLDGENLYNFDETVKNHQQNDPYYTYRNYLPLLSKMLNMHNCIPDHVKKKVKSETCTTNKEFNSFIHKYRDRIKQEKYEFGREKVLRRNIEWMWKNNSLQNL